MNVIRAEARFATGGDSQHLHSDRRPRERKDTFSETVPLDVNLPNCRGVNAPAFSSELPQPPNATWLGG